MYISYLNRRNPSPVTAALLTSSLTSETLKDRIKIILSSECIYNNKRHATRPGNNEMRHLHRQNNYNLHATPARSFNGPLRTVDDSVLKCQAKGRAKLPCSDWSKKYKSMHKTFLQRYVNCSLTNN